MCVKKKVEYNKKREGEKREKVGESWGERGERGREEKGIGTAILGLRSLRVKSATAFTWLSLTLRLHSLCDLSLKIIVCACAGVSFTSTKTLVYNRNIIIFFV